MKVLFPGARATAGALVVLAMSALIGAVAIPFFKDRTVPWGRPVSGLQIGLLLENTSLIAGDGLRAVFYLRGDPATAGSVFRLIDWPENNSFSLIITDPATGRTWGRYPGLSGMPFFPGDGGDAFVDLRRRALPRSRWFSMVSPAGEVIPPGAYTVTAVCRDGRDPAVIESEGVDSATVWSGTAFSGAVPITIREGGPIRRDFPVWTEVEAYVRDGRQCVRLKPSSRRIVSAEVRRGYATGRRMREWIRTSEGRKHGGGALSSGLENRRGDTMSLWDRPITASPGDTLELEYTAFETSEKTPHMWSPESGDFRILWQKTWEIPVP